MRYGLIGARLGHSFSKEIHEALGRYEYELMELKGEELPGFLRSGAFSGINVTIPYKQAVIPYLEEISDRAKRIGAVNTIVNRDGRLFGYNTDFAGMQMLIRRMGLDPAGKKVLIAGSGGTSRTAAAVMESMGAAVILRMSRDPDGKRDGMDGGAAISYRKAYQEHSDAQILVNTTPAGMYPDTEGIPVDLDRFPSLLGVVDVVYNPLVTRLVRESRARGIPAGTGLYMLVAQAYIASEIFMSREPDCTEEDFTDREPDCAEEDFTDREPDALTAGKAQAVGKPLTVGDLYRSVLFARQNIVLIGMPGSGKTTIGRCLSERLGRPCVETDAEIERREGRTCAEIIRDGGERYFRNLEAEVIREAGMKGGAIISTGGGAVLLEENRAALGKNGVIVFLHRPLAELCPTGDRPLSDNLEKLERMMKERLPVYRGAADLTIPVRGTPEETAEEVLRAVRERCV